MACVASIAGALLLACRPAGDPHVAPPRAFDPTGYPLVDAPGEPGYMPQIRTGDPPPEPRREIAPEEVAHDVAAALRADPLTAQAPILVYADRGVVVLGGTVPTLQAERQAANIALAVPGVGTVISRIRVAAPVRDDIDIEVDVQESLREEPAVNAARITVDVDGGDLRLTGIVTSDAERFLAEHVAAGVSGVRSLQNQLQVSIPLEMSDDMIETTLSRRFAVEPVLSDARIDISVDRRTVWLSGVVPDEQAFARARWIATRAATVRDVDTSGLVVEPAPED